MAGFRDADLYPLDGPRVAAARALMAGRTATAVLYTSTRPSATLQAQIIQTDLAAIGITVDVHQFPRAEQIQREGTLGEPFDMTTEGWIADYPDADDFLALLDGRSIMPFNNNDVSDFNDPGFNAARTAANDLTGTARASALGSLDVDTMRDDAPWAPIFNLNQRDLFARRIGCQVYVPAYQVDLGALCDRGAPVNGPAAPSVRKPPKVKVAVQGRDVHRGAVARRHHLLVQAWSRDGKAGRTRHPADLHPQEQGPRPRAGLHRDRLTEHHPRRDSGKGQQGS